MLSPEVRVLDIDARHWMRLLRLFAKPADAPRRKVLVVMVENDRCLKAWHSEKGPLVGFAFAGSDHLEEIRAEQEVDAVALISPEFLPRLFSEVQKALVHDADWDAQLATIVDAAKTVIRRDVRWHPGPPWHFPDGMDIASLERRVHRLWPDGTCLGFFLFEGRRPYTSLILGKVGGKITLVTTLDAFGLADGPLDPARWKTVADLCRERFHPLRAALWMERACFEEWLSGPRRLAFLSLALRRGRAAIQPFPLVWRILLFIGRILERR